MNEKMTISQQLRARRKALGLSLSEVARKADTSSASLSRYENGWTRFETYTLRKLASALDCELRVTLLPRTVPTAKRMRPADLVAHLQRLFWDHDLTAQDITTRPEWVLERVLDYGSLEDIYALLDAMGKEDFLRTVSTATRVSPRTRSFWCKILEREGIECMRKFSRNTAWNC